MMTYIGFFFFNPSSNIIESIIVLSDYLMMFLVPILILVALMLFFSVFSYFYNSESLEMVNLEVIWTIVPILMVIFIIYPTVFTLYLMDSCYFCGISVSITGHQWYWSYQFSDFSLDMDSFMADSSSLRLIEVDNCLILPYMFPIRFQVSSEDVIHSWAVPSLSFKVDAIPGRINEFCAIISLPGVFVGQCSELCGINHSFMPINLNSVSFKSFLGAVQA